jgi:hypothetical protein
MTRRGRLLALAVTVCTMVAVTVAGSAAMAVGEDDDAVGGLRVVLTGYQEDPLVISTTGNGTFRAHIDDGSGTITYQLTYAALVGNVTQAHLHLGGRHQSGGIMVFLCTNLGNGRGAALMTSSGRLSRRPRSGSAPSASATARAVRPAFPGRRCASRRPPCKAR